MYSHVFNEIRPLTVIAYSWLIFYAILYPVIQIPGLIVMKSRFILTCLLTIAPTTITVIFMVLPSRIIFSRRLGFTTLSNDSFSSTGSNISGGGGISISHQRPTDRVLSKNPSSDLPLHSFRTTTDIDPGNILGESNYPRTTTTLAFNEVSSHRHVTENGSNGVRKR